MESLRLDLRLALRLLARNPAFTATVALSLALGIGANTAIFTLLDTVLWRTLPVADPNGLRVLAPNLTYQQYRRLADDNQVADLAAYSTVRLNVSVNGSVEPTIDGQLVTGGYFPLLGVAPSLGRAIGPEDDKVPNGHPVAMISAGYWQRRFGRNPSVLGQSVSISGTPFIIAVCIVNEAFVRRVFPGENPLGKPCYSGRRPNVNDTTGPRYATAPEDYHIVGVVKDSRYTNPRGEPDPIIYTTFLQTGTGRGQMVLHVRVAGQAGQAVPRIRDEVLRVDSTLPAFDVHTLAEEMDAALVRERLIALLSTLFGGLALLLASVGLYGLLSFGVVQRTSELGVRMALGAGRGDVVRLVLREAMMLVVVGLAVGVPAALATARLASSQISGLIFRLQPTDPLTIAIAVVGLTAVALVAAYLPARRASRVSPLTALKAE